jgi:hypothetical protein
MKKTFTISLLLVCALGGFVASASAAPWGIPNDATTWGQPGSPN